MSERQLSTYTPVGVIIAIVTILNPQLHAESVIRATRVATDLSRPVYATSPPGDTNRLFIAEQHTGEIKILDLQTGSLSAQPFLDIGRPSTGNEQGLLGLAFDPNFAANGHFYVNYTDSRSDTNVDRFTVGADGIVDVNSRQTVITFDQPQGNHNGGWIGFGPDNYLYVGSGDGGSSNDNGSGHTSATGNGQDMTGNLLGKMLRLDVSGDDFPADAARNYAIPPSNPFIGQEGDDEIWSYGLRNPWRASFDRLTGDLYIGDVGQNQREEINFQPAASPGGENYGWRLREGLIRTPQVGGDPPPGAVDPIHDYTHVNSPDGGFSVTGGYVYRGPLESLQGNYFFGDFVSEQIWSLQYDGHEVSGLQNRTSNILPDAGDISQIASFAEDELGNLYVISLAGDIYRFDGVSELAPIVPMGSDWKYLDDGSNLETDWRTNDFDDASWQSGPAQLGYGDGDEATLISFGGDSTEKHLTTYFRHRFDVENPEQADELIVELLRDDGAAVYLNGVEIERTNLVADAAFDRTAEAGVNGAAEDVFSRTVVDGGLLLRGENVLAVEIHQVSRSSSDMSFDLQLSVILRLLGDFDENGKLDAADVDDLNRAIRAATQDPAFDVTGDGRVDVDDLDSWVRDLKSTWFGDANLDGEFDSSDLTLTGQGGEYEDGIAGNSGWSEGDWDGDAEFGTGDFVRAFTDGGYENGPRPGRQAVPEPNTAILIAIALLSVLPGRRRTGLGGAGFPV